LNSARTVSGLSGRGLTSSSASDFTGLSKLRIYLHENALTSLPDNIFAKLSNLEKLYLVH